MTAVLVLALVLAVFCVSIVVWLFYAARMDVEREKVRQEWTDAVRRRIYEEKKNGKGK